MLSPDLASDASSRGASLFGSSDIPEAAAPTMLTTLRVLSVITTFTASFFEIDVAKRMAAFNTSISAAKHMQDFFADMLMATFGIDVTGQDEIRKTLQEFEAKGATFLDASFHHFSTEMLTEARTWKTDTEALIRAIKPSTICTINLTNQLAKVTTLISKVLVARRENKRRPVPAALYFHGEAGRGKTSYLHNYFIPSLNKAFGLAKDSGGTPFNLNAGKHFTTLTNERWALFDEFGSRVQERSDSVDATTLNNIVSGTTSALPGAAVDEKNQVSNFNGVFLISNRPIGAVDVGFTTEAKAAFISRWAEIQVIDPKWKPSSGRTHQSHRDPEFKHLQFVLTVTNSRYKKLGIPHPTNVNRRILTSAEVVALAVTEIKFNQEAHQKMQKTVDTNSTPSAGFELWTDTPESFEFHNVYWISGEPGRGKTTVLIPELKSIYASTPWIIQETMTPLPDQENVVYILDDIVDPGTRQGQRGFMDFANTINKNSIVIAVTNHINPYRKWHINYYTADIRALEVYEPGFLRRCGAYTARHFFWNGAELQNFYGSGNMDTYHFMKFIYKTMTHNAPIEIEHLQPPDELDYDIDIDLGAAYLTPIQFIEKMCISAAVIPKFFPLMRCTTQIRQLYNGMIKLPPPVITVKLLEFCREKVGAFTIRVRSAAGVFAYHDGVCYLFEFDEFTIEDVPEMKSVRIIKRTNDLGTITYEQLRLMRISMAEPHMMTPPMMHMASLRLQTHPAWDHACSYIPFSSTDLLYRLTTSLRKTITKWWESLNQTTQHLMFFALIVIALWALLKFFRTTPTTCDCKKWPGDVRDQDTCPYDMPEGKTKGAARRSRFTHFKAFKYNTKIISEEQAQDHMLHERIWGTCSANAQAGQRQFEAQIGPTMRVKGRYDDEEMRWIIEDMDMPESTDRVRDSALAKKLSKNSIQLCAADGAQIKATMLTGEIGITARHFNEYCRPWAIEQHTGFTAVPIMEDRYRELLVFRVQRSGIDAILPGACHLNKHLLSLDQLRTVECATIMITRTNGTDYVTQAYEYQERPALPFDSQQLRSWQQNVGLVAYGNYKTATSAGDCGSPVIAHYGDSFALIGIHAGRRGALEKFASVVLCKELWNEIATKNLDKAECLAIVDKYPQMRTTQGAIYTPPAMRELATKRTPGSYVPQGALSPLFHIRNMKPMDGKNRKHHIDDFPLTIEGMDRKIPALPAIQVRLNYEHLIPNDKYGNKFPFLIRTQRLEQNFHLAQDPSLSMIARQLGDFYFLQSGRSPLCPLSITQAITQDYRSSPLDLGTTIGVFLQRTHPGATSKFDLVTNDGKFLSTKVEQWTKDQWTMAAQGKRLSLPCDANYKSETLAIGKEYRKRIYYNVPLPTILNLKRIFAPLHHAFASDFEQSPYVFNADPIRDWDVIYLHLFRNSGKFIPLDAKSYDNSVSAEVILATEEILAAFYGLPKHDTDLRVRIRTLLQEVAFMPTLFENVVVEKQGGIPSGIWGTDLLDDMTFDIMLAHAWIHLTQTSLFEYFTCFVKKICGDDVLATINPRFADQYNGITIQKHLKSHFNVDLTPSQKTGEMAAYVSIDEATFCSRHFVPCPDHPTFKIPKLKTSSLSSALEWTTDRSIAGRYEQYVAVGLDLVPHGSEIYDRYARELVAFANKHRIQHIPITYPAAVEMTWQRVNTPRPRRFETSYRNQILTAQNFVSLKPLNYTITPNMSSSIYKNNTKLLLAILARSKNISEFHQEAEKYTDLFKRTPEDAFDWNQTFQLNRPNSPGSAKSFIANTTVVSAMLSGISDSWGFVDLTLMEICRQRIFPTHKTLREYRWNVTILAHHEIANCIWARNPDALPLTRRFVHKSDMIYYLPAWIDPNIELPIMSRQVPLDPKQIQDIEEAKRSPPTKWRLQDPDDTRFYPLFHVTDRWYTYTDVPESADPGTTEGGTIMSGGAGGTQLDPLVAPAMTMTPAQAVNSQEIADSDNTTVPTVLDTIGGLTPLGLPAVNYADNIVSLCDKPILVRRYAINASTLAGTIIEEIPFDPWNSTLVSKPIWAYGGLHGMFSGSMNFQLNSYSASTIIGSLIVSYVPPIMQKNFSVTLENLKTVPSAVLNLKVGGTCQISINAGNLTDAAVSREKILEEGGNYGKIIIAAYTDIVNSYGVSVSVPVMRLCSLGTDAYFSHPWYLYGTDVSGPILDVGPVPPAADNLIIDGGQLLPDIKVSNLPYFEPENTSDGWKLCHTIEETETVTITEDTTTTVYTAFWWGHNKQGPTIAFINTSTAFDWDGRRNTPFIANGDPNYVEYTATDSDNYEYLCPALNTRQSTFMSYTGVTATLGNPDTAAIHGSCTKFSDVHRVHAALAPSSFTATEIRYNPADLETGDFSVDFTRREAGHYSLVGNVTVTPILTNDAQPTDYAHRGSMIDDGTRMGNLGSTTFDTPRLKFSGVPKCTNANTSEENTPNGYYHLRFDRFEQYFIPAVNSDISSNGRTMPYVAREIDFMESVRTYFLRNKDITSYTYDMSTVAGATLGTVLVNRHGCFVYTETGSAFALYTNAATVRYTNFQAFESLWPSIPAVPDDVYTTRIVSPEAAWAASDFSKRVHFNNIYSITNDARRSELLHQDMERMTQEFRETTLELMKRKRTHLVRDEPEAMAAIGIGAGLSAFGNAMFRGKGMKLDKYKADLAASTAMRTTAMSGYASFVTAKYMADQKYKLGMAAMGYDSDAATQGVNHESSSLDSSQLAIEARPDNSSAIPMPAPMPPSVVPSTPPGSMMTQPLSSSLSGYVTAQGSSSSPSDYGSIPSRRSSASDHTYATPYTSILSSVNRQNEYRRSIQRIPSSRIGPSRRTTTGLTSRRPRTRQPITTKPTMSTIPEEAPLRQSTQNIPDSRIGPSSRNPTGATTSRATAGTPAVNNASVPRTAQGATFVVTP
jgi:hypothetical protein